MVMTSDWRSRQAAVVLAAALVTGCGKDSPPPDTRTPADLARPDHPAPDRGTPPDRALPDRGGDLPWVTPAQFVGTWKMLETVCENSPAITFVDYSYTLELEETKGSAVDASSTCALTTADFPIVAVPGGYQLKYGSAQKLSCSPSPCKLVVTTKVGDQTSSTTYNCPADFPVEVPDEVIVTVQGAIMVTQYVGSACFNRYQRTGG